MKDKLSKEDRVKIRFRSKLQKFIRDEIDNIQVGDMDQEEFEIFRQEATDLIEILQDKDKFMELKKKQSRGREKHISKYFDK